MYGWVKVTRQYVGKSGLADATGLFIAINPTRDLQATTGWVPEPVSTRRRREKFLTAPETDLQPSNTQPVALMTDSSGCSSPRLHSVTYPNSSHSVYIQSHVQTTVTASTFNHVPKQQSQRLHSITCPNNCHSVYIQSRAQTAWLKTNILPGPGQWS